MTREQLSAIVVHIMQHDCTEDESLQLASEIYRLRGALRFIAEMPTPPLPELVCPICTVVSEAAQAALGDGWEE